MNCTKKHMAFGVFAILALAFVGIGMVEGSDAEIASSIDVTYSVDGTTYTVAETTTTVAESSYITLSAPKVSIPAGYAFGGWSPTEEGTDAVTFLTVTDGMTTAKAYAILIPTSTVLPMTITYVVEGQADITVTVPEGTPFPVKLLTSEQFSAYGINVPVSKVFAGWYLPADIITGEGDCIITEITAEIADDMTVYATFEDNTQYTVTIDGKAEKVWAGTVLDAPEAPAVEGKVFKCWMVGEDVAKFPMTVTSDIAITSVYEDAPAPEPAPVEKKDNSLAAILCVIGIVFVVGAGLFVWTLKKDKKD